MSLTRSIHEQVIRLVLEQFIGVTIDDDELSNATDDEIQIRAESLFSFAKSVDPTLDLSAFIVYGGKMSTPQPAQPTPPPTTAQPRDANGRFASPTPSAPSNGYVSFQANVQSVQQVPSNTEANVFHEVTTYVDGSQTCSCKGFENRGYCRHTAR